MGFLCFIYKNMGLDGGVYLEISHNFGVFCILIVFKQGSFLIVFFYFPSQLRSSSSCSSLLCCVFASSRLQLVRQIHAQRSNPFEFRGVWEAKPKPRNQKSSIFLFQHSYRYCSLLLLFCFQFIILPFTRLPNLSPAPMFYLDSSFVLVSALGFYSCHFFRQWR